MAKVKRFEIKTRGVVITAETAADAKERIESALITAGSLSQHMSVSVREIGTDKEESQRMRDIGMAGDR